LALAVVLTAAAATAAFASSSTGRPPERFVPVQAAVVVPAGGRATVGIRVRRPPGKFERNAFRFARVPDGLRLRWTRNTANGDLTLTISAASDLSPGRRNVFIAYVGGASANVRVVTPAPSATFALTVQPSVVEIPLGERRDVRIALQPVGRFTDQVALSVDAPPEVTASVDPDTLTTQNGTAVLRLTGSAAGAGQVVVNAQGGGTSRRAVVAFRVVEPPLPAPVPTLTLERNEARNIQVSLAAGQVVAVRAVIEEGDVDMSAFDAAGSRVALSANNGTTTDRIDLSGPGEFTIEFRAVVNSRFRIETGAP
jgi:hypothetical protein